MTLATFGAGCFWGVEETLRRIPGVIATAVGYMGGALANPTYEDVCTDESGHAEVVQIEYDPTLVTYDDLLAVFFSLHDPTTMNRQGPDVGTQYRSVIFFHTPEQKEVALKAKTRLEKSGAFAKPIVTEIVPAAQFWCAEEYHQKYFAKRGGGSSVSVSFPSGGGTASGASVSSSTPQSNYSTALCSSSALVRGKYCRLN